MNNNQLKPYPAIHFFLFVLLSVITSCSKNDSNVAPDRVTAGNSLHVSSAPYNASLTAFMTTFAGNGDPATLDGVGVNASINTPVNMAIDGLNNLFVTDPITNSIRKITPDGTVTTFAGGQLGFTNGKGSAASFNSPQGLAVDANNNLYVADAANQEIRKITPDGTVSTFAGRLYVSGSKDGRGTDATFNFPFGLAFDQSGNLYVTDLIGNLVRKITPDRVVSTVAGSGNYLSVDGTGNSASFANPQAIAVDKNGTIYVEDSYGTNEIRKITTGGVVTTIIARGIIGLDQSLLAVREGRLYIGMPDHNEIQTLSSTGVLSVFAGGSLGTSVLGPTNAPISLTPYGMVFDKSGNMFCADGTSNVILKLTFR
ncbi:MAG TPA: hypothetical protein VGI43_18680 [Mucilaginibacter sp.]